MYFSTLFWHSFGGTRKETRKNQSGISVPPLSFESSVSLLQFTCVCIRITVLWNVRPYSDVEFCQPLSFIYPEKQCVCPT